LVADENFFWSSLGIPVELPTCKFGIYAFSANMVQFEWKKVASYAPSSQTQVWHRKSITGQVSLSRSSLYAPCNDGDLHGAAETSSIGFLWIRLWSLSQYAFIYLYCRHKRENGGLTILQNASFNSFKYYSTNYKLHLGISHNKK